MTVYRGTCEAPRLADGVEFASEADFLALNEGDEFDVRMPGDGPHYTFAMSEPGDLVKGIGVRVWSWVDLIVTLQRVGPRRYRLGMTEAQELVVNGPHDA